MYLPIWRLSEGRIGKRWSPRKGGHFVAKTKTARTERGSSCFLYFSFYLPSHVTAKLSLQMEQRHQMPLHWECQHVLYRLTPLTPLPFWGRFGDFSCPEDKSQGDKSSQLVLLATQALPHLCSRGKLFANRPCLAKPYCSNQLESACKQHTHPKAAGQLE